MVKLVCQSRYCIIRLFWYVGVLDETGVFEQAPPAFVDDEAGRPSCRPRHVFQHGRVLKHLKPVRTVAILPGHSVQLSPEYI